MTETVLYYGYETCARVTMTALEEIGLPFTARRIDLSRNEQKSPDYLAINPSAEVPALRIGGRVMTQNAAILHYLHAAYPAARLLPPHGPATGNNEPLQDLLWCACTLHILRRQVLNPPRVTAGLLDDVRAKGIENWQPVLARIARRLEDRRWWYGDTWSVIDVYLTWSYSGLVAERLGIANYPSLIAHEKRLQAHPAYIRALAREREGLTAPPDVSMVIAPRA
jgi:glutathione S-transferase